MRGLAVWIAAVGLCLPQAAPLANAASEPVPILVDVTLSGGGMLIGQVVDPQGVALADVPVSLRSENRELAMSKTDCNGSFAFHHLRGGLYQVAAAENYTDYRVWTPGTAPPTAQRGALIVAGKRTVRGQRGMGLKYWLSNPWVVTGIVATAVAVPVAIHNADRRSASE